ncbi:non-ribosomal peptide synthetase [Sciscionella sediminilitoris]|uniref:non-ribosomal peptide synthetase n=1 Tax=Sciscionella sediminilitoris TaxID=1445613 RepID=UPI000689402A|nr:non-ribosomal peptide synthetase [Sciscionella sp. SE31]
MSTAEPDEDAGTDLGPPRPAGTGTPLPRWAGTPCGVETVSLPIPGSLIAALHRVRGRLGVSVDTLLFAAHAKVVSVLCGDDDVLAAIRSGAGVLGRRVDFGAHTWSELIRSIENTPGEPGTEVETAVGAHGPAYGPPLLLDLGFLLDEGRLVLRYRTELGDTEYAHRIGGYHLTALAHLTEDPRAPHREVCLPSDAESHRLIHGFAGPAREIPERGFTELFEQRAARFPDAEAAAHGTTRWTYRTLNAKANQLARALCSRGLRREQVVGVLADRGLDWMAAVLAVFKAGGAYLPIEPELPRERIETMLRRSGCTLMLVDGAGAATARELRTEATVLDTASAWRAGHADTDLGISTEPDQLAYLYFTSGSTGEPKGAMCEQAGMLNHLFAKIDDLEIGEGQVIAQTAPQCFDISLWQLIAGLLVGARTVIAGQDVVKDVDRLLDLLEAEGVTVVQLVPSYLEVMLTRLVERHRELPALRYVSVTGEAVKKALVQRWFSLFPEVAVVNAYGLTETSDDTNHEVLRQTPDGARVPLGRPVNNVFVYVLDEALRPVPLGAPGEIVFSGVCVGRGYINDPERTERAFLADPHRPGERLYRSGDLGRWRPDGKLEFLGRRDTQVKVRGRRIELGEIENRLLEHEGVRDGAVLVLDRRGTQRLLGCYTADAEIDPAAIRATLTAVLPGYMVPDEFRRLEALPLTANGKIDKRALAGALAEPVGPNLSGPPPNTPAEQGLAAHWAAVLNIPVGAVGRGDHFFEAGGTSLSAIRLVTKLDKRVSLRDVIEHPVLSALAELLEQR